MLEKECACCHERKPLGSFFSPPEGSRADAHGTSTYCKQCHADAMIPYGYGWYGDRYTSPGTT